MLTSRPATVTVPPTPIPTVLQPLLLQPDRELVHRHDRRVGRARDVDDVARVVRVPVGQEDDVSRVDSLLVGGTRRIPFQPRVGDDALSTGRGDDERRVAEPGDGEAGHGRII